ncbi:nucleoporin-domain-containing protein, partial [Rhizopogon salebrosus TDB-379]
ADLPLDKRLEYLTLAVANAKSHPVTIGGKHETAISFLTDLEEKLDVAQVQLEVYHALLPHLNDPGEAGQKIRHLNKTLLTMSELYQVYAEQFDLPVMKLLILHVSEHHDEHVVRPIWDRIFDDAIEKGADAQTNADHIIATVVPLGKRFYPSESAFPLIRPLWKDKLIKPGSLGLQQSNFGDKLLVTVQKNLFALKEPSDVLCNEQRCGSFCGTNDVMLYKARESIRKAMESRNPAERHSWLGESLRLFTKGARMLDFDKMREVCGEYQQLGYAKGAVELLTLSCAQALDSNNAGLEYWYAVCPPNDTRKEYYGKRLKCYDLVLHSLSVFEEKASQSASAQVSNTIDDPEAIRSHAYDHAFSNEDEIFHSALYDWLIDRGLADELLAMRPPFLEAHLKREPVTVPKYQLLWQFYVKDGQPLRAAEILATIAESDADLPLDKHLEYLTLAVANAKSHPVTIGGRHETAISFLTDLEEKLDVAQVQLELYQVYTKQFDLPVMKLLILHVSEHHDEHVVHPIWDIIFDDAIEKGGDAQTNADHIIATVVPLGKQFYPSESAFPLSLACGLQAAPTETSEYGCWVEVKGRYEGDEF